MFKYSDRQNSNNRLDSVGRSVLRSASLNETEANAALSPFMYARVRARIAAEHARREAGEGWLSLLFVARRAMPAMALAAAVAFGSFWFGGTTTFDQPSTNDVLFAANDLDVGDVVFDNREVLSTSDTLDTILRGDELEESR